MKALSENCEFRGMENKQFTSDQGEILNMTVTRFDDESGQQNEFYIMDSSKVMGFETLKRGCMYNLQLSIGKNNKVKLLEIFEA